jgi:hypothetical protein
MRVKRPAILEGDTTRSPESRRILIWGWLRLALGIAQMGFSATALYLIYERRLGTGTWVVCAVALSLLLVSRLVFRGRKAPTA